MDTPESYPRFLLAMIFGGLCIVLFSHLNTVELRGEEPRRAIVAMEMNMTGEYIVPKINGWNYYNKPPLFNWLLVLCFKLFGSYETWVVRIPSLISFLLTGLVQYFFVKKYHSKETALLSSLFFLTAGDLLFYGTQLSGEIDLFFTFLVCLQIMSMYHFFRQEKFLTMFLVSYAMTALGVLTKGPPAIVFQGITLLVLTGYHRRMKLLFHWKHFAGILGFLAITGPYFLAYAAKTPAWPFIVNLFNEATQKSGLENQSVRLLTSVLTYPLLLIQWLLPWSLFAVYLFSRKTIREIRADEFLAFAALFILANIPLYWLTSNPKSRYVYMFFPFFTILLAYAWQARHMEWPRTAKVLDIIFSVFVIAIPLAALVLPWIRLKVPIDHALFKGLIVFIPAIAVAWYFFDQRQFRLYAVILALVLTRLLLNFFYLPSLREGTNAIVNKGHVEKILSITEGQPVALTGKPYRQENNLDIGPIHLIQTGITTAPLLSYMIPYYYTTATGAILDYQQEMKTGRWYLIYETDIPPTTVDTLYRFEEPWTRERMALVRKK